MSDNVKYSFTNSGKCKPDFTKLKSGHYWVKMKGSSYFSVAYYYKNLRLCRFIGDTNYYDSEMIEEILHCDKKLLDK